MADFCGVESTSTVPRRYQRGTVPLTRSGREAGEPHSWPANGPGSSNMAREARRAKASGSPRAGVARAERSRTAAAWRPLRSRSRSRPSWRAPGHRRAGL